jgi:hypothetical protein
MANAAMTTKTTERAAIAATGTFFDFCFPLEEVGLAGAVVEE